MEKQRARTTREKEARRTDILNAAKKLFPLHGFDGTKIHMITKEAGLSPAAFYLYFKNKLEIYRTLCLDGTSILKEMILQSLEKDHAAHAKRIEAVAMAYFSFFNTHRDYYKIISVLHLGQPEFFNNSDLILNLENQSVELLNIFSMVLRQGIKDGEFKPVDPWKTAAVLWAMMDGILMMEVRKSARYINVDITTLTQTLLDISMSGLALKHP